jgi:hypothetical protein
MPAGKLSSTNAFREYFMNLLLEDAETGLT